MLFWDVLAFKIAHVERILGLCCDMLAPRGRPRAPRWANIGAKAIRDRKAAINPRSERGASLNKSTSSHSNTFVLVYQERNEEQAGWTWYALVPWRHRSVHIYPVRSARQPATVPKLGNFDLRLRWEFVEICSKILSKMVPNPWKSSSGAVLERFGTLLAPRWLKMDTKSKKQWKIMDFGVACGPQKWGQNLLKM